jgi:hypothetical protein
LFNEQLWSACVPRHWVEKLIPSSNSSQEITRIGFHPVITISPSGPLLVYTKPLCKLKTGAPSSMQFTSFCQKIVMLILLEQYPLLLSPEKVSKQID